ncbi:vitelline membrane protein Vm26Aa [Teleopsis dalmanni]|uniref:vitelline membrane protein Vm26Aa n=1 Tax=Teleopsis dalmanni TaxID=139649 RepID=UPI0018CCA4C5|nr:vitelline membrane protein Vm26Aa [Teleopsis dalmanni]
MKSFVYIFFIAAVVLQAAIGTPVAPAASKDLETDLLPSVNLEQNAQKVDLTRLRKSAGYGGSSGGYGGKGGSIPAPACPKNYLFSCQPNLAAIPCASSSGSYGSQGAYSVPVPTYANPLHGNYQYAIAYIPQGLFNNHQYYQ